jgi:hypothetical protein
MLINPALGTTYAGHPQILPSCYSHSGLDNDLQTQYLRLRTSSQLSRRHAYVQFPMPLPVRRINPTAGYGNRGKSIASSSPSTYPIDNGQTRQMISPRGGLRQVSTMARVKIRASTADADQL